MGRQGGRHRTHNCAGQKKPGTRVLFHCWLGWPQVSWTKKKKSAYPTTRHFSEVVGIAVAIP